MRITLAIALLSACTVAEDVGREELGWVEWEAPRVSWGWSQEDGCGAPDAVLDAVATGIALWTEMGFEVLETGHDEADVIVCVVPGPFWDGRWGLTELWSDVTRVKVRSDLPAEWMISAVAAHEAGHAFLRNVDHIPAGEFGILASNAGLLTPSFTDADYHFLTAHGFTGRPL